MDDPSPGRTDVEPPTISVVIPCLNVVETIAAQLDALAQQQFDRPFEVVIVENGSTDGSQEIMAGYVEQHPSWKVVEATTRGSNAARNVGWRASSGDMVLFCDGDDIVKVGWVAAMVQAIADGADLVGGSFDVETLNPPELQATRSRPTGLPAFFGFLPSVIGANFAVRRTVLEQLDGFDETFSVGGDETEFSWRVQLAGFRAEFAPGAEIAYRFRASTRAFLRQRWNYAQGAVKLYVEFRDSGMRRPKLTHSIRLAGRSLKTTVMGPKNSRLRSFGELVSLTGHLRGSLRHRTFFF